MHTEAGLQICAEWRSTQVCPTGETYTVSQDNHLHFQGHHPLGALSLQLRSSPSASLRNQTFPGTSRQRPGHDFHPARQRSPTEGPESGRGGARSTALSTWTAGRQAPARPAAPGTEGRPPGPRGIAPSQSARGIRGPAREKGVAGVAGEGPGWGTTPKTELRRRVRSNPEAQELGDPGMRGGKGIRRGPGAAVGRVPRVSGPTRSPGQKREEESPGPTQRDALRQSRAEENSAARGRAAPGVRGAHGPRDSPRWRRRRRRTTRGRTRPVSSGGT